MVWRCRAAEFQNVRTNLFDDRNAAPDRHIGSSVARTRFVLCYHKTGGADAEGEPLDFSDGAVVIRHAHGCFPGAVDRDREDVLFAFRRTGVENLGRLTLQLTPIP